MSDDDNKINPIDLDMSLDDIEDMPGFLTPPTGAYVCEWRECEQKDVNDHPAFEVKFKIAEVHEVTGDLEDGEASPKVGDEFNLLYMADNKFGAGQFKELCKPIGVRLGTSNLGQIVAQAKGMQLLLVISRKYDKKKDKNFSKIKKVAVI